MQCYWSTTARTTFRRISHCPGVRGSRLLIQLAQGIGPAYRPWRISTFSRAAYALPATPVKLVDVAQPVNFQLTHAQASRAACRAVHLVFQNPGGGLEDAYLIVNSLRYSTIKSTPLAQLSQSVKDFQSIAINFGRPISPRLSSHALLHGLIRIGRKQQASDLAVLMMETGMRVRTKTLETFTNTLVPAIPSPHKLIAPSNFPPNPLDLADLVPMARDESTRFALQLFAVARKTHHRRTSGMFGTLLCICLINGEIILASLIFGFVVKDWQLKKALKNRFNTSETNHLDLPEVALHHHFKRERLNPTRQAMAPILKSIDQTLAKDSKDDGFELSIITALQALANLAVLLDHQQLPFGNVSSLIRSLYRCPRVEAEVWVVNKDGHPELVQAYSYFHDVLERLMKTLPSKQKQRIIPEENQLLSPRLRKTILPPMLPELDLHACNALLYYALRHRLSPSYANTILNHMTKERNPPLQPEDETLNILLRSGTLLRQSHIAEQAMVTLQQLRAAKHDTPKLEVVRDSGSSKPVSGTSQAEHTIKQIAREHLKVRPTSRDASILLSHIMHITSTGCPQQIETLVFKIFPELRTLRRPVTLNASKSKTTRRKRDRRRAIFRAIAYGPHLLTSLLNALIKARKTRLARGVWHLAERAEKWSWKTSKPWMLPVHAYTLMLRYYMLELKKIGPSSHSEPPFQPTKNKTLIYAHQLYQCMKFKEKKARKVLRRSGRQTKIEEIHFPRPDPLFFNTALKLFMPTVQSDSGLAQRSKAYFRRQFELARRQHVEGGQLSEDWNPILQEIGEDIVKAGFSVPPALRHIFIGRWDKGTWSFDPPVLTHVPFAFPDVPSSSSPFYIPTKRERGFPFRRRRQIRKR